MSNRPPPFPPPHLAMLDVRGRSAVGLWHNVLVIVFREPPDAERLREIGRVQQEVGERFPDGFVALAVLPTRNATMPDGAREEAERLTANASPALKAVAQVIEGRGFAAAAVRSVAAGMALLHRPARPLKVFDAIEPAAAWLSNFLDRDRRATAPRLLVEAIRNSIPSS